MGLKDPQNTRNEPKGESVALGCLSGWGLAIILITIGGLLCLTGIGAILGIPMIIAGLLSPFAGALLGLSSIKGPCPYCGHEVSCSSKTPGVTCPACKKRIIVKEKKFYKVD